MSDRSTQGKQELLPCPFCGGEAHVSATMDSVSVQCRTCWVYMSDAIEFKDGKQVKAAHPYDRWNTRAAIQTPPALCERMQSAIVERLNKSGYAEAACIVKSKFISNTILEVLNGK